MQAIKQIFQVAKWSFIDWLMDIRQIFVLAVLICISNYTVMPLLNMSKDKGVPINILEPFLANIKSVYIILIIFFCWLVLISDYPKMEGNNGYILIRINRITWLIGKILAFVFGAIVYLAELVIVFTARALGSGFFANGWSYLMRDYMEKYSLEGDIYKIICVVREDIFNHYLPYAAFRKTLVLLLGLLCALGLVMTAASLSKSKLAGLLCNLILIVGGFLLVQTGNPSCCWLPVANVMLGEQATQLIRLVPKNFSYIYFGVLCAMLFVCCLILVRWGQVQKDGER